MKRKATAAQIDAAREKKAKVRAMLKQIAGMTPEQQFDLTGGAVKTVENRTLSMTNSVLVYMQGCKSSVVGGFKQWRKVGRTVRKGEHGVSIWVPGSKPNEETGKDDMFFFLGTVFGIDQTEEMELTA